MLLQKAVLITGTRASQHLMTRICSYLLMSCLTLLIICSATLLPAQQVLTTDGSTLPLSISEGKFIKFERPAGSVFLSNPGVVEIDLQSTTHAYIVGRGIGESSLFILDEGGQPIMRTTVTVDVNVTQLQQAMRRALPDGNVSVSSSNGAIFLTGNVESPQDAVLAEDILSQLTANAAVVVNNLTISSAAQVNLQVRIAEVSSSIREDLGINLAARSGGTSFAGAATGISGFALNVQRSTNNVNLVLDALAEKGLVTILSEPNLTARSGETATFLAGGQVPIRIGETAEDTRVDLETIGVELEFTPTVFDRAQIQLKLSTKVRDVEEGTGGPLNPSFRERSATTTVEIASGQSFAIAGMFRVDTQQSLRGLPGLIDLPIIGALFRSSRFQRGETELVIIVTPVLVAPTDPANMTSPTDNIRPTTGLQQAITGRFTTPDRPRLSERPAIGFMLR